MRTLRDLLRREDGLQVVEYAVMLAVIILAVFALAAGLGDTLSGLVETVNVPYDEAASP